MASFRALHLGALLLAAALIVLLFDEEGEEQARAIGALALLIWVGAFFLLLVGY